MVCYINEKTIKVGTKSENFDGFVNTYIRI